MSEWIPITERLPNSPGRFMCYYTIDDCGEVGHCIDWGKYDPNDGWYASGVTHWMPLPEPPNEETVSNPLFDIVEEHDHCHVQVLRNSITGEVSVGWWEEKE